VWRVDADRDLRPEIARRVIASGGQLRNMALRRAGLDEVYVRYFEQAETMGVADAA
jgi:ABC-2 type transport system ATP-binding protein